MSPMFVVFSMNHISMYLTQLHSERPKLYAILAFLSAVGLKEHHCDTVIEKKNDNKTLCKAILNCYRLIWTHK